MFLVIFVCVIWFTIWVYFTVLKLLVKGTWWLLGQLLTLDRHTHLPGSKPIGFYVKRALTHHRARVRERQRAKAVRD
jgi:hypothetical protein